MSTDEFAGANGHEAASAAEAWSRPGSAMIVPGGVPDATPATRAAAEPGVRDEHADGRTPAWSAPALAIASFVFACSQAFGGLVAGPIASLIPSAADSPANHVRIIAVIYIGMSCAGAVLAWVALRRAGEDSRSPRWASYLAGAAALICALVAAQALVLLMLSMLAPGGAR